MDTHPTTHNENEEEGQYLALIKQIFASGHLRTSRQGGNVIGIFGHMMKFDLSDNHFPLLTTKRVFWRGIVEELLWFIKGDTNANHLKDKGIHIWDANASKAYLTSQGLGHREEGDLGPVYGFQWRHFGAQYTDMHADYTGQGIDQLAKCIETIKSNPTDRRIVMSAWNPCDVGEMALPPCHTFCQFYVEDGKRLSCSMYQRSCDVGLGVPFNIASYALLTRLVAHVCHLEPGQFVHIMGDTHIYANHVDALKIQIERQPRPFPTLTINPDKRDIDTFTLEDLTLEDYNPHPAIKMDMS